MGLFNPNYSKPGPGVSKDEPKKKGLARFYQIFIRKFWDLIKLNFLYTLTLIPTFAIIFVLSGMISNKIGVSVDELMLPGSGEASAVSAAGLAITTDLILRFYISVFFTVFWGGGPATAGFMFILRSFLWENPVFLISDYFAHIKSNIKQSLAVWIIDIAAFTLLCYAYFFYAASPGILVCGKYVIIVIALFYTMLHLYLYHLLVTYKLSIGKLYKNSALFALSALPFSVLTIAVISFVLLIFPLIGLTAGNDGIAVFFTTATVVLMLTLMFSTCGLYIENNAVTQIKKYIKEDADVERNE